MALDRLPGNDTQAESNENSTKVSFLVYLSQKAGIRGLMPSYHKHDSKTFMPRHGPGHPDKNLSAVGTLFLALHTTWVSGCERAAFASVAKFDFLTM